MKKKRTVEVDLQSHMVDISSVGEPNEEKDFGNTLGKGAEDLFNRNETCEENKKRKKISPAKERLAKELISTHTLDKADSAHQSNRSR